MIMGLILLYGVEIVVFDFCGGYSYIIVVLIVMGELKVLGVDIFSCGYEKFFVKFDVFGVDFDVIW